MKYYKNLQNTIYAFELDGSQDHLIPKDLIKVTRWEVDQILQPKVPELTWDLIKEKRNELLRESDWTDLPNSPVSNRPAWLMYRQRLRDLTKDFNSPAEVLWPQAPQ